MMGAGMKRFLAAGLVLAAGAAQAQAQGTSDLDNLSATIWTDPNGCEHWVSDHGLDGYMSERLTRDGRPVCPGRN